MPKKTKLAALIAAMVIALSGITVLFCKNVIYNAADGVFHYGNVENTPTYTAYYMISLPYFTEQRLEQLVTEYVEKHDLFNKIIAEQNITTTARICIYFNRPSLEWPLGKVWSVYEADDLSTTYGGNNVATVIATTDGSPVTDYVYSSNIDRLDEKEAE